MSTLGLTRLIAPFVLLGAIGAGTPASNPSSKSAPDDANALRQRIESLASRNRALMTENADLQRQVKALQLQALVASTLRTSIKRPTVPDGWTEKNFNGMKVYIVPLDGSQPAVAPVLK